jgi:hypothetical protein
MAAFLTLTVGKHTFRARKQRARGGRTAWRIEGADGVQFASWSHLTAYCSCSEHFYKGECLHLKSLRRVGLLPRPIPACRPMPLPAVDLVPPPVPHPEGGAR